jgi:hypothetical protein
MIEPGIEIESDRILIDAFDDYVVSCSAHARKFHHHSHAIGGPTLLLLYMFVAVAVGVSSTALKSPEGARWLLNFDAPEL